MSAETPEQLNDDLQAGWEHLRSTAASIAELQTAMWGDWAEMTTGLATGRLAWGEVYSEFWKFVAEEDLRFALELSELGIDYAQKVSEVTWEHEQRLRDHLRRAARRHDVEPLPTEEAPGDGDTADAPAKSSRSRTPKQ
ncbi:hypothetical protein ABZW03_04925 [Kitasatospora sp. NPDC004799]|uniref:hypothetical protein n=1 Tax=Kitasatospora sp. NPDC004799 TaxID=3154460 RepID=UPI0033A57CC0